MLLILGCGSSRMPEVHLSGRREHTGDRRVIEGAFEADSRAESAEPLYAPFASVIADGRPRRDRPRVAGVADHGEVATTTAR